jgi:hypothetical protein
LRQKGAAFNSEASGVALFSFFYSIQTVTPTFPCGMFDESLSKFVEFWLMKSLRWGDDIEGVAVNGQQSYKRSW